MKTRITTFVTLLAAATMAFAGNNAAPLGFELGTATRTEIQAGLGEKVELVEKGISKFSGGVILEGPGDGLGTEHLQRVAFIFDAQQRLAAVELQFPKGFGNATTTQVADVLQRNYGQVRRNIPAVGDASARYSKGSSVIDLDAPHMSFDFTVAYMTEAFEKAVRESAANGKASREAATRSRL